MTRVKVCGLARVADVQAAVAAGADAVGFMFYSGSARNVNLAQASELSRHAGQARRVGVFVNATEAEVRSAIAAAKLDVLQFHGNETAEFCARFASMPVWKAFRIRDRESLRALSAFQAVQAWLLDSYVPGQAGGTGAVFNWDLAVEARELGTPIILAGGLTPENVAAAIRQVQPWGVDVSSGVESAPGTKSSVLVRRFIDAVRAAES